MKILLVFENGFDIDKVKLSTFLKQKSPNTDFSVRNENFEFDKDFIQKPNSFSYVKNSIFDDIQYDSVFIFTDKPYEDNYFFHGHENITIFSFYAWSDLTNLSKANGVVYFIVDVLALDLYPSDFRHQEVTGCIYDFLWDKTGVDDGMRQAIICPNCLKRLETNLITDEQFSTLDDLKELMNSLSNSSKWNNDILEDIKHDVQASIQRKSKNKNEIHIAIASPGDTVSERETLLSKLEIQFRRSNHESHCKHRLIVHGWEELASQGGYPQDVINEKIIQKMDFVVALFKHKLGTPTFDQYNGEQRAESGTAEELLQSLDHTNESHPLGMVYFYSKAPNPSLDDKDVEKIRNEWDKLTKFKGIIKNKMIYKPYTDNDELLKMVIGDLELNIIDQFKT